VTVSAPTVAATTTAPAATKPSAAPTAATTPGLQSLGFPAGATGVNLMRLALDAQGRAVIVHHIGSTMFFSRWNGSSWQNLTSQLPGPTRTGYAPSIEDFIFDARGYPIVATSEHPVDTYPFPVDNVLVRRWNGAAWVTLGRLTGIAKAELSVDTKDNVYTVTNGDFQENQFPLRAVVRLWNGKAWVSLGENQLPAGTVATLWFSKEGKPTVAVTQLITFSLPNAKPSVSVLQWNGKTWQLQANSFLALTDTASQSLSVALGIDKQPTVYFFSQVPNINKSQANAIGWTGSRWEKATVIGQDIGFFKIMFGSQNQSIAVLRTDNGYAVRTRAGTEWRTLGNFASNGFDGDKNGLSDFAAVSGRVLALGIGSEGAVLQSLKLPTMTATGNIPGPSTVSSMLGHNGVKALGARVKY
jgi:hypothetical protein